MNEVYLGNPNLKKVNVTVEFTQEQIIEFEKFLQCKVHHLDLNKPG